MGNRSNDMAYAKMDFTLSGDGTTDFKQDVKFAWHEVAGPMPDGSPKIDSSSWKSDMAFIYGDSPDDTPLYATQLEIEMGFDNNSDGRLQPGELAFVDPMQFKDVSQSQYDAAVGRTEDFYSTVYHPYPHAANFLYAFVKDQGLDGANNVNTTVASSDNRLDHHDGANFTVSGNANKAIFNAGNPATTLPQDIADSDPVAQLIENTAYAHKGELLSLAPPVGQSLSVGSYNLVNPLGNRIDFISGDLHFAIGNASIAGQVDFQIETVSNGDGTNSLLVVNATLVGQLTDLYDFRYGGSDSLATPAAAVEAGYPSLGSSGHIYEVEVNMNNTVGTEIDLGQVN